MCDIDGALARTRSRILKYQKRSIIFYKHMKEHTPSQYRPHNKDQVFGTHPQQEVFPTLSFLLSPHSYMSSYESSIFLIFFHWIPKIIFYGIINLSHFLFAMIWLYIWMDHCLLQQNVT